MSYTAQRTFIAMLLTVSLVTACNMPITSTQEALPATPLLQAKTCGDGICDGPENPRNCPEDCGEPSTGAKPSALPQDPTSALESGPSDQAPVLYLGIMVHLEGWDDDKEQAKFEHHVRLIREYADLFERYGAKLTLESKEVTQGVIRWGDNVLLELEGRGHGIGVHADVGGQRGYDCGRMAFELRQRREQLESLGVDVRHVSGNTSECDWVAATIEAGYLFTTGQVAYSVMSMPVEKRPPEYRDCPGPAECHQTYPPELADRLHPWRTSSGEDWLTHDPSGELVILPSSQGLYCMQEELEGQLSGGCTFNLLDIDFFEDELKKALALAAPDQVNIYYVGWSLGSPLDQELLESWLARIQPYVDSGQVRWVTLLEMFDAYLAWEAGR
jgi:hypothetical protein